MAHSKQIADYEKTIRSLKTTPTGAISITYYKNGKKVGSVGVNKIEDLHEALVNLFKYTLQTAERRGGE